MKTRKFNVVQYRQWDKVRTEVLKDMKKKNIKSANAKVITKLHSQLFNHKESRPCCPNVWLDFINALEVAWSDYNAANAVNVEPVIDLEEKQELRIGGEVQHVIPPARHGEPLDILNPPTPKEPEPEQELPQVIQDIAEARKKADEEVVSEKPTPKKPTRKKAGKPKAKK